MGDLYVMTEAELFAAHARAQAAEWQARAEEAEEAVVTSHSDFEDPPVVVHNQSFGKQSPPSHEADAATKPEAIALGRAATIGPELAMLATVAVRVVSDRAADPFARASAQAVLNGVIALLQAAGDFKDVVTAMGLPLPRRTEQLRPSRIVHLNDDDLGLHCTPAICAAVYPELGTAVLRVFDAGGPSVPAYEIGLDQTDPDAPVGWHWPERS